MLRQSTESSFQISSELFFELESLMKKISQVSKRRKKHAKCFFETNAECWQQLRHQAETFAFIVTSTKYQLFNQQNISPEKTPPPSRSELNEIRTVCLLFLFCFLLSPETPAESSSSNEHREKRFKWMKISNLSWWKIICLCRWKIVWKPERARGCESWKIKPFSWLNYPPFFASFNFLPLFESCLERNENEERLSGSTMVFVVGGGGGRVDDWVRENEQANRKERKSFLSRRETGKNE